MNRLSQLRQEKGLNMREAARGLNMPYTTYVNYEKGTREPNSETLIALAEFYGVSIDYLLCKSSTPNSGEIPPGFQPMPAMTEVPLVGRIACGTPITAEENVERMAEALREAGLEVCVHENVMNAIWHKLLANVAINGMSALLETKNGFVDGNQYAHEAARMLVEEAITVANACGCTLDHDAELEHAYEVSRMTDETLSSMVQDVTHHRETEIRIITGAVCRLGREHGIATPCNDLMLQLVLAKQSIYLGR